MLKSIGRALRGAGRWAGQRLREPSTYAGAAIIATTLGADGLAQQIGAAGQAVALILGTGLVAATTSSARPPAT